MRISFTLLFLGILSASLVHGFATYRNRFYATADRRSRSFRNSYKFDMKLSALSSAKGSISATVASNSTMTPTKYSSSLTNVDQTAVLQQWEASNAVAVGATKTVKEQEYQRGLWTIGIITLMFASNSPVLHAAFVQDSTTAPPVLLLNAAVSLVALVGLLLGGESLESQTPLPSSLQTSKESLSLRAGCELGLWKFLGTTANLYGLAYTTAGHGALLIQLTTLIVPVVQGIQGIPIPTRIQGSIGLALAGVLCFTQDQTGTPSALGDALCVVAAIFYATYDLRLFEWGQKVPPRNLITSKIATQATLSLLLVLAVDANASLDYLQGLQTLPMDQWATSIVPVVLWCGVVVNALAPFLQVGGQQAVGPTRCQTIYASQFLWAALLSYVWLGETIGLQGLVGGTAFLVALFLAATTEMESPTSKTIEPENA